MNPPERNLLAAVEAALREVIRYDDESIVAAGWIRRRYDLGECPGFAEARQIAVRTAWHEAGHAVAALAVGARFSSVSIHPGRDNGGRVRGITGAGELRFVIDAAGQIAERLMNWTMLEGDAELREWLAAWRADGGDAKHFAQAIAPRFGGDKFGAWRHSEGVLAPLRLQVRQVARALLVHPRHLPYGVVAALAAGAGGGPARGPMRALTAPRIL